MTARFSRAAQQSVEFARTARGHRPRLQLTEYRLNWNSSTSGVLTVELPLSGIKPNGLVLIRSGRRVGERAEHAEVTKLARVRCAVWICRRPHRVAKAGSRRTGTNSLAYLGELFIAGR